MIRSSRPCALSFILLAMAGVAFTGRLSAADSGPAATSSQPAPIVIQQLRIDRIETLIINASPTSVAPPPFQSRLHAGTAIGNAPSARATTTDHIELAPRSLLARRDRDHPTRGQGLEIHVLDLGQADATFVIGPPDTTSKRKTLLIDVGEISPRSKNYQRVSEKIQEMTHEKHLDYFVATHFHSDHVGGADNGISGLLTDENFKIETVIDVGTGASSYFGDTPRPTYEAYEDTMSRAVGHNVKTRVRPQFGNKQIELGPNVTVDILAFAGKVSATDTGVLAKVAEQSPGRYDRAPPSENDLSIALEVKQGNFEFFTAGDLTGADDSQGGTKLFTPRSYGGGRAETYTNVESWMVNQWTATHAEHNVEIYRVNHHGSNYSSTPELLNILKPEFMIYSCGGKYGHPSPEIVHRGAQLNARQFVTGKLSTQSWESPTEFEALNGQVVGGDIDIVVDQSGSWYWIQGELHKAFSDAEEAEGKDAGEAFVDRRVEID